MTPTVRTTLTYATPILLILALLATFLGPLLGDMGPVEFLVLTLIWLAFLVALTTLVVSRVRVFLAARASRRVR